MGKVLDFFANKKNKVFLVTCLYVHVTSLLFYAYYEAPYLAITNAISSTIYVVLLIADKSGSDRNIMIAFIEIIFFSVVCEMLTVGTYGFIFYTLGMVAVIFHLVSATKAKRAFLQLLAIIGTFLIYGVNITGFIPIKGIAKDLSEFKAFIVASNLVVTVSTMVYVSFLYIIEQEKNKALLEYNINHDQLTGLYNRRFFYTAIETIRKSTRLFSLAMVDLDNFKRINDTYGHECGDEVLKALSGVFTESLGENDIAVRWGGEEFILFMPGIDVKEAEGRLEHMLEKIRACKVRFEDKTVTFTATIGLASCDDPLKYEQVINEADQNLYYGKNNGKNRIVTHVPK